ncbi:MAG: hypothetical protein KC442_19970, partial [Thermomicrobiales bacterium]|nr:hypothetical protein [Thermomicrobiales bacterium]
MTLPTSEAETLPRWNLDVLYPGPDSPELHAAMHEVQARAETLRHDLDGADITLDAAALADIIDRYNALLDVATTIEGYVYCLTAADVTDEAAAAAASA